MEGGTKVFCINCVHYYLSVDQEVRCMDPDFTAVSYGTGQRISVSWDHKDRNKFGCCRGYEQNKTTVGVRDVSKEER